MKAFSHKFKTPLSVTNMHQVRGFTMCMDSLLNQLLEMTGRKPENRFIDAVVLLDMIAATNDELKPMMQDFENSLYETPIN
jgi:hypothetical protein